MVVCKRDKATGPVRIRAALRALAVLTKIPRLRQMPDGQLFATITHGARTMPAYGPQVPVPDRWSIVAYVRALEVSQMAEAKPSQPEPKK